MNYQKFYKVTVSSEQLRQAFLSITGVTDLISKIIESMYTGAEYDEYQVTLYMIAKQILNGRMYAHSIDAVTTANMKSIVSTVKGISNQYTFMKDTFNVAGVKTHSAKNDQFILMNSLFDATMDGEGACHGGRGACGQVQIQVEWTARRCGGWRWLRSI